jgi:hypothetical protein
VIENWLKGLLGTLKSIHTWECECSVYVFKMGSVTILWTNKKQSIITISSMEVEYKADVGVACEVYTVEVNTFKTCVK